MSGKLLHHVPGLDYRLVRRLAVHADLTAPKLSFRTLDQVVAQTREAARAQREAVASM